MKAILLSIKPEYALNILEGRKTLELRKRVPKDFVGWVYVYVTKATPRLSVVHDDENGKTYYYLNSNWGRSLNEDIPFRFWFDEYDTYNYEDVSYPEGYEDYDGTFVDTTNYANGYYVLNTELEKLCLSYDEFETYGDGKPLYVWHIKKLEIFDKPMELIDFVSDKLVVNVCGNEFKCYSETASYFARKDQRLTKAPQSYQYVWVKE